MKKSKNLLLRALNICGILIIVYLFFEPYFIAKSSIAKNKYDIFLWGVSLGPIFCYLLSLIFLKTKKEYSIRIIKYTNLLFLLFFVAVFLISHKNTDLFFGTLIICLPMFFNFLFYNKKKQSEENENIIARHDDHKSKVIKDSRELLKNKNFISRHWNGETSLLQAFWLNYCLINILFGLIVELFYVPAIQKSSNLIIVSLWTIIFYVFSLMLVGWQVVGVWRSANKYSRASKKPIWGDLAKFFVIIIGISSLTQTTLFTIPQCKEFISILFGDKGIPEYKITVLPGGTEIEFKGGLRSGASNDLQKILNSVPQAKVLHIDSVGGRITEAIEIGKMIQKKKMTTYCSSEALSAATVILMNGYQRIITPDAVIGFHSGSFPGALPEMTDAINSTIRNTMKSAGVSERFTEKVLQTSSDEMWYPSYEEMEAAGVVTGKAFGERFASKWGSPDTNLEKVFKGLEEKPMFKVLQSEDPVKYNKIKEEIILSLRSGGSEGDAIAIINQAFGDLFEQKFSFASDLAVNRFLRETIKFLETHKKENPQGCVMFLQGANVNYTRVFKDSAVGEGLTQAMAGIIISAGEKKTIDIDHAEKNNVLIISELFKKYGDDIQILSEASRWNSQPELTCQIFLDFYSGIESLGDKDSANQMRWLLTQK